MSSRSYRDFCEQQQIKRVEFGKTDSFVTSITFSLQDPNSPILSLRAYGDCCSFSWFHFLDSTDAEPKPSIMDGVIGKYIRDIRIREQIELKPSDVQEVDRNHIVHIEFTDDSHYELVLRNSSNGYYDGWIDIAVIDSIYPPGTD